MTKKDKDRKAQRREMIQNWAKRKEKLFEPTCIRLPEGLNFYKFENVGTYKLDFMLFIAGEGNHVADNGFPHCERTYDVHRIEVPGQEYRQSYACRRTEFKENGRPSPCAICEYLTLHGSTMDPKLRKEMRAQRRHLWLVNDRPGEVKNPLKVLDTNHFAKGFGFGEMLQELVNSNEKYSDFADPIGGYTAILKVIDDKFPGGTFKKVTRIDLDKRDYDYPEEMIEEAPCLDDCIIDPGYDKIMDLLESGRQRPSTSRGVDLPKEDDDEPRRSRRDDDSPRRTSRRDDDDEDEDEVPVRKSRYRDDDEEEDTPKRSSRRDDDDEDEEPKSRKSRDEDEPKSKRSRYQDDDDDEVGEPSDLEDDEDEEPVRGKSRR